MVWPFSSSQDASTKKDPYSSLDPSLREFLEKESPLRYHAEPPPPPPALAPTKDATAQTPSPLGTEPAPAHPNKSLFADGRYDHLWRTYQPKSALDAAGQSDQEKLSEVLGAYKQRRASISKAAVENCAAARWQQQECITRGTWKQRLEMCRYETRALERCFTANVRLLKALGYLSAYERPPEEDERIQMHADKLYQRLQEQERLVEQAQKEGREPPVFAPVLPPERSVNARGSEAARPAGARLSKEAREQFDKKLQGKSPEDRYYEEQAMAAELDAVMQTSGHLEKKMEEVRKGKQERRERGEGGFGDAVSWFLGW